MTERNSKLKFKHKQCYNGYIVPKTILLVEDERALSGVLGNQLTQKGYRVIFAQDGLEGLKKLLINTLTSLF